MYEYYNDKTVVRQYNADTIVRHSHPHPQELTIEMFQDDGEDEKGGSRENLVKAPPLSIPAPVHRSDGMYDSQV